MSESNTDPDRLAHALDGAAQADSVGDLRELLRAADKVRSAPKPALSAAAAARIEHAALNRFRAQRRAARSSNRVSFTQFAIALSLVLALIIASAGTVAASAGSLPGEPLYPVKRFVESTQLSLAAGDQRAALHITFAETRLAEIEALSKRGGVPPGLIDDLAAETESALTTAQVLPADQQTNAYSNIVSMIDHQQAVLAAVQAKAPEPAQAALAHAQSVSARGKKTALEAIQKIKETPPGHQQTPPGQARTPPGQQRTPTAQNTNTPVALATTTPPPPSQTRTPSGQQQTAPGQQQAPPGQQQTPPGQQQTPPGQQQSPPGQEQAPPGQQQTPPGQSGDKGNAGGGKP